MGRASPPSSQRFCQERQTGFWVIARISTLYAPLHHLRDATVSSTTPNLSFSERPEMSYVAPQTSILELSFSLYSVAYILFLCFGSRRIGTYFLTTYCTAILIAILASGIEYTHSLVIFTILEVTLVVTGHNLARNTKVLNVLEYTRHLLGLLVSSPLVFIATCMSLHGVHSKHRR